MTKYSTGSSDEPDPDEEDASCSMCGSTENLRLEEVAGAKVTVCGDCSSSESNSEDHRSDQNGHEEDTNIDTPSQSSGGSNSSSGGYTITNPDSSWVEDSRPDYGSSDTPYLIPNYSKDVQSAIEEKDVSTEEIADETGMHPDTVQAVVDGNAISAGVDIVAIEAIENYLDIEIQERMD